MTKIVIVDSVKGGCGKTTEALIEAVCRIQEGRKKSTSMPKVCIIDMDILGTSMESMIAAEGFIRDDVKSITYIEPRAKKYLNDIPDDLSAINDCVSTVLMKIEADEFPMDFIVSSPYSNDRRKFRKASDSNYTVEVTPTHFRGVMKKLVESLIDREYDSIIFDMPPNSDDYTNCVLELFLNKNYRREMKEKIHSVELKIVSTLDDSHVRANSNWLIEILENSDMRYVPFDKITLMLNNNSINGYSRDIEELKKDIEKYVLGKMSPSTSRKTVLIKSRDYSPELNDHFLFRRNNNFNDFTPIKGALHEGIDIS